MTRTIGLPALTALLLGLAPSSGMAAQNEDVRFALHVKDKFTASKTISTLCEYSPNNPRAEGGNAVPCAYYSVYRPANEFPGPQVFLVVGQGDPYPGINAASCGIEYTGSAGVGIDPTFVTWTSCTDGETILTSGPKGPWPAPGGGLEVTWTTCQQTDVGSLGVQATLGAFYVYAYSSDVLRVTANYTSASAPEVAVTGCNGNRVNILEILPAWVTDFHLGRVQFGAGSGGWVPCWYPDPVQPTTWGRVKTMYRSDPGSPTRPD